MDLQRRLTELALRFVGGLAPDPLTVLVLVALGTGTLVLSMIMASWLAGGIDFGPATTVTAKAAGLLVVVTALNFFDFGILVAGPVWFFGLMLLFRLDFRETFLLARVNWGMSLVWKLLLLLWML